MSHLSKTPLRILSLSTALSLFAACAYAQNTVPPEMTLSVSAADIDVLAKALDRLPIAERASTIIKIQAQIDAQPRSEWAKYQSATTVQDLQATQRVTP
jgi:hypothetical protein